MKDALVWLDLEMTGLDPDTDQVLEIAVIVTDGELDQVEEGPDLVLAADEEALQGMSDYVRKMHANSGLTELVRGSTVTVSDAEQQVLDFVTRHVPQVRAAPLAGNSVHADRAFLRRFMPKLEAHLHYRHVDVSVLKELAKRWTPQIYKAAPDKAGGHRALADIRESIEELRHYRRALFDGAGAKEESA